MNITRIVVGAIITSVSSGALGWAFRWSERQRVVVLLVLSFFVQGLLILVTQIGVK